MLDGSKYKSGDPIYTFVADDGTNTHIDSKLLREWCLSNKSSLEVFATPVDPKLALRFQDENIISPVRVFELWHRRDLDPVIYCKSGTFTDGRPDVMLVDGHHRYTLAAAKAWPVIPAYILELNQWKPFQIDGLPDLTVDFLRAMPITSRNY